MTTTIRKQINLNDRMTIENGLVFKESIKKIAKELGVHPSTVTREIKNNRTYISDFFPMAMTADWHPDAIVITYALIVRGTSIFVVIVHR